MWPGQAPDAAWGQRPMAWASVRCGHGKRTASKLGTRPVTLRRISQHPPVTSKLGLSSRLALPAHFHRQPGFLMCGLLNEALTRHVVKAQLTRHTHTHSHMHTGKRQQTRHTRTQLPAGAIVANLASSAHALYALCIRCLHANRRLPFQAFTFPPISLPLYSWLIPDTS